MKLHLRVYFNTSHTDYITYGPIDSIMEGKKLEVMARKLHRAAKHIELNFMFPPSYLKRMTDEKEES